MIILHLGIFNNQPLLWGETPIAPESTALPKQTKTKKKISSKPSNILDNLPPLPYDAKADQILVSLKEAGIDLDFNQRQAKKLILWLPTIGETPLASNPLIAEPSLSIKETALKPWTVTVFHLSISQIIEVLCGCVDKQTLAPGVVIGRDLNFWTKAMRFAGALVTRQQFLPGIIQEAAKYRAVWKPVLTNKEKVGVAKMAQAMPAVTRAFSQEASVPPQAAGISILSGFVDTLVDHLVRSSLPNKYIFSNKKSSHFDSIHDQWLFALHTRDEINDTYLVDTPQKLALFKEQVNDWQRPIAITTMAPFRLCFRLEEPKEETVEWYVRYLLQASNDPSLLIPAEDAWKEKKGKLSILKNYKFNAREYLLLTLGQASGISPDIETSLKTSTPAGYKLDSTCAHGFLTEKAIMLEQAGFGVMLPAWWTRKGTKLHLTARANVTSPKLKGGGGLSLNELISFDWEIALGEERLTLKELETLAKLKVPLVKVRGQWVQIKAEEIQAALDFWKKKANGKGTVRDIVQMAIGAKRPRETIDFAGVTATGWVADLLAQLEGRANFEELSLPHGFNGELRPYQSRGFSWLSFLHRWGLGACLADDMGLGKTIQTLALIQRDWQANPKERRPVLLICPTSVVGNWQKEASRFTPDLPVMVHHGLTRAKGETFKKETKKKAIVISSYALLHRDFEILKDVFWTGVILDEAQNIKNPETKQAKAARSLGQGNNGSSPYKLALTGTPVENNVGDLWSIMEFLNPGFLGQQAEFKRRFFIPIQTNRDPEVMKDLKKVTGPFILRRLKTDKTIIKDLPEKMEMKVFCNLTKEQASLYTAVVKEASPELDSAEGIQRKGVVLATLMKLKQVCNHPAQFLGDNSEIPKRSGKLARLTEMLEEVIEIDDRALIFSQFFEMGGILKRHLQETFGQEVLFLHGGVPKKQRDQMVERFQAEEKGPSVFILSLKAGGTGLNLTKANHVFHFDRWWNPAVENQATDRAFRIGQTKNVQVHKFLCVGTLEERIDEMIERKKDVAQNVVGTGEGWLTELSTKELKELFTLRKEAVGE
ncbi:MAG: DEAD/DEAH box helicase [bacterium]